MSVSLLDANVLLALAWPNHLHHAAAHRWFKQNHQLGWATCPLTQLAFVRLSMQPAVVKIPILFGDVMTALAQMTAADEHSFWPIKAGLSDIHPEIHARIMGHNQLTDAALLDLAIRHKGRLATFDRKIASLLPPSSPQQKSVVIIPA